MRRAQRLLSISLLLAWGAPGCVLPDSEEEPSAESETLDETGGHIRAGDVELEVPPGALSGPTEIAISRASDHPAPPGASERLVPVYRFEPEGLEFAEPVKVSFYTSEDTGDPLGVFWTRPDQPSEWQSLPAAGEGTGPYSAEVSHFSFGFLGVLPCTCTESNECCDGCRPRLPRACTSSRPDGFAYCHDGSCVEAGTLEDRESHSWLGSVDVSNTDSDDHYVYSDGSSKAYVVDSETGGLVTTIDLFTRVHQITVSRFAFGGDFVVLAGCRTTNIADQCLDGFVGSWDYRTGEEIMFIGDLPGHATTLSPHHDVGVVGGSVSDTDGEWTGSGFMTLFGTHSGNVIPDLTQTFPGSIDAVALARSGDYIAAGGCRVFGAPQRCEQGQLYAWDRWDHTLLKEFTFPQNDFAHRVRAIAIGQSSPYATNLIANTYEVESSSYARSVIRSWDVENDFTERFTIGSEGDSISANRYVFLKNAQVVAADVETRAGASIALYDNTTGELLASVGRNEPSSIWEFGAAQTGGLFVSAPLEGNTFTVWRPFEPLP